MSQTNPLGSARPKHCSDCGNPDCPKVTADPYWTRCPAEWRLRGISDARYIEILEQRIARQDEELKRALQDLGISQGECRRLRDAMARQAQQHRDEVQELNEAHERNIERIYAEAA
jgi:DNA-directed RNA polymerase subunit N (RpoN/RPB10)